MCTARFHACTPEHELPHLHQSHPPDGAHAWRAHSGHFARRLRSRGRQADSARAAIDRRLPRVARSNRAGERRRRAEAAPRVAIGHEDIRSTAFPIGSVLHIGLEGRSISFLVSLALESSSARALSALRMLRRFRPSPSPSRPPPRRRASPMPPSRAPRARATARMPVAARVLIVKPKPGAHLELRSDASGRFAAEHLVPGGPYRVEARAPGISAARDGISSRSASVLRARGVARPTRRGWRGEGERAEPAARAIAHGRVAHGERQRHSQAPAPEPRLHGAPADGARGDGDVGGVARTTG